MRQWIVGLLLLTGSFSCAAGVDLYAFDDPQQEAIYRELIEELRCLVCQNQNIADSNAELAQDMRRKTYELVKSGRSKSEITEYMSERYGDFMLYRPPVNPMTWLLWFGPAIVLLAGFAWVLRIVRRQAQKPVADAALADDEAERLRQLQDEISKGGNGREKQS